ncbi:MAG: PucC family protein, partial [Anaerolineae bacterium]
MQRPVKRVQVALIHVAVSITIFPVESTLNREMINELAISALLVGALLALPYLFSPVQVAIGAFADRNPIFGLRRTPYIVIGLTLCLAGCLLAPYAAFSLAEGGTLNILLAVLMFGLWGTGFNFATVSYFSIASELWDEQGRSTTIALMFLLMIASFIAMASVIGRIVDPYTTEALFRAFRVTAAIAFVLGFLGVIGLEPRRDQIVVREP